MITLFEKFEKKIIAYRGDRKDLSSLNFDKWLFFTKSSETASYFGKMVYKVELILNNPFVVDAKGENWLEIPIPFKMKKNIDLKTVDTDMICEWALDNGYDSVIIKNVYEGNGNTEISDDYIVFNRKNILSLEPFGSVSYKYGIPGLPVINKINESTITDVVFHRTSINALYSILKTGKILMSTSMGTNADVYSKKPYFLSLSRTKFLKFGYSKNSNVTIELDGSQLKTKYKGKSIDYWQWDFSKMNKSPGNDAKSRTDSDEYEDRLFSNDPYLSNLDKYVKYFDIMIPKDKDRWNEDWINSLTEYVDHIKGLDSPLLKKVRVFTSENDFNKGKNWISIFDYKPVFEPTDKDWTKNDEYSREFDYRLFRKVIAILLIGNKDEKIIREEIQKFYNKFIKLGAVKLKNDGEEEIKSIIWSIKNLTQWGEDSDFIQSAVSDIHNLGKSSRKSEINYEILKLLSDEMIKYKVRNVKELIDAKRGVLKKETKDIDYSKKYGFVCKRYDRYELVDNNSNRTYFIGWHKLDKNVTTKVFDLSYIDGNNYEPSIKNVINGIFNSFNENKAKEVIFSITDVEYKLIELKGKLIYREITEKDYLGDDIGHRGTWMYVDKGKWVSFLQENMSKEEFKKLYSKILKLTYDDEVKIRFIWAITERLIGEEKTKNFFEDNNLIPIEGDRGEKEKRYLINIGEKVKEPEHVN